MNILGCDPGLGGALAFYATHLNVLKVYDIPTHELVVAGRKRRRLDAHALRGILADLPARPALAVIEDVHALPKQGVTSSFSFGKVAGAIEQVLVDFDVPIRLVQPGAWKRYYGLTASKDDARRKASQLLPAHAHLWSKKSHDGRAESALLAYYGAKVYASAIAA